MAMRTRGFVLIGAGAVLALVALAADPLGLGGYPGIGWKQILGMLAGAAAAIVGFLDLRR